MRTFRKLAGIAGGIIVMASCNAKNSGDANAHAEHQHGGAQTAKVQTLEPERGASSTGGQDTHTVGLKDDLLNAVYEHYIQLTAALVDGKATEARIAANAIELGMKQAPEGSAMAVLAAKISSSDDLERQRTAYASLSELFIKRVKASGVREGKVYVEYCPMAMNDQGASWLSNQQEIRNPYFGDSMLDCGSVKETLQ